ncbi:MAG: DUF4860 domain-containing protein [Lachnospiraceae bacterium]|nr:DUF4860 domain-containing protein [Lachnospiraceae bacterium]
MTQKYKKHTIDILFVITLFCVFAVSIVMLTGTGAAVYEKIVSNMDSNYNSRTAGTYLFNKLHRSDNSGNISLGEYCGSEAVILMEEIDNINYCTYIYYYDNRLMEMFTRFGQEIDPSFGTEIMELKEYEVSQISDTLFLFKFTTMEGERSSLYVHTRTARDN